MWSKRLRDHLPSPCRQLTFLPLLVECARSKDAVNCAASARVINLLGADVIFKRRDAMGLSLFSAKSSTGVAPT
jgi:hypothetical protein